MTLNEMQVAAAEQDGWNKCLRAVVASLKGYPDAGGDVDIMAEVDRIRDEAKMEVYR